MYSHLQTYLCPPLYVVPTMCHTLFSLIGLTDPCNKQGNTLLLVLFHGWGKLKHREVKCLRSHNE